MRSILSNTDTSQSLTNSYTSMSTINNYQTSPLNSSNTQRLDWETLRKQARQLENEIDSKLVAFSKLSSTSSTRYTNTSQANNSSELLFATLSNEIEESLKKLNLINNKMTDCLNVENNINSNATVHTLQRHRDILRDYSNEYEKTKRNIVSLREREKLLSISGNNNNNNNRLNDTNLNNRRMDSQSGQANSSTSLYMKEYDHIKNSHNLIDQQIELAELTKENLQSQKQSIRLLQQKMNSIANKFPMINNLVQKIKFKKRKDTIILATVISICLIIMLLYLF